MSAYQAWLHGGISGYEFALWLAKNHRGLFDLKEWRKKTRNWSMPVQNGSLWYALPEGALVSLYEEKPKRLICDGRIEEDEWRPVQERFPSPMAIKLYLHWENSPVATPRPRPGIVLGEPASKNPTSRALFTFQRALWIAGQSKKPKLYGELGVAGSRREGWYRTWEMWGIDARHGFDLLEPTSDGDLAHCTGIEECDSSLTEKAQRLAAEFLGVAKWSDPRRGRLKKDDPFQWELGKVQFGSSSQEILCLVVSPDALNARGDSVVLQCIGHDPADDAPTEGEGVTTAVPLPPSFRFNGERWTIDLTLVRGVAFAWRYWRPLSPDHRIDLKDDYPDVHERVAQALEDLYA